MKDDIVYCDHCGVELEAGVTVCPLCGGPSSDQPLEGGEYELLSPDGPRSRISARAIYARTALLVLGTVFFIVTIVDLAVGDGLSWAPIVWAALLLVGAGMLMPLGVRNRFVIFVVELALVALLLLTIDATVGASEWFVPLGLPIVFSAGVVGGFTVVVLPSLRTLSSSALVLGAAALLCVAIEVVVSTRTHGGVQIRWSWIVLVASVPVAAFLVAFEQTVGRHIDFRRRFHT